MPLVWLAPAAMWAQEGEGADDDSHCCCSRPCCQARRQQQHAQAQLPPAMQLLQQGRQLSLPLHMSSEPFSTHGSEHDPELSGRTVLVVLPGGSGRRRLLRSMRATGARVLCYATDRCPALDAHMDPNGWILGPADNAAGALAAVQAWIQAAPSPDETLPRRIDSLFCYNEFGLELYVQLAEALHLAPGTTLPRWMVEAARSKRVFRRACVAAGLPAPRFAHLTAPATSEHPEQLAMLAAAGVPLPAVVKPSGCAGSFSVLRVNTQQQLQEATQGFWQRLPAYLKASKMGEHSLAATDGVLVEELVQGHEVDIDCIVYQGQLLFAAVSDNHPCTVAFIETGGRCPSALPDAAQEQLLELTAGVISLFGPGLSAVLHFEAMYDPVRQLAVPIELNARIGGGETYVNVLNAWGVDLAQAALRIASGLRPRLPEHLRRHADPHTATSKLGPTPMMIDRQPLSASAAASEHMLQEQQTGRDGSAWGQIMGSQGHVQVHGQCGSDCSSCDECRASWGLTYSPDGQPWALWALKEPAAAKTGLGTTTIVPSATAATCHGLVDTHGSSHHGKVRQSSNSSHSHSSSIDWYEGAGLSDSNAATPQQWLRAVQPLRCIHSVNFVPDWAGDGILERLDISPAALSDSAFVDAELYLGPGDEVQMPPAGFSALGWMVAQAEGPEEAALAMERLLRDVTIKIRPPAAKGAPAAAAAAAAAT